MPNINYIIMVMIALHGVLMVITNKPLFFGTEKYTKKSLEKYPRAAGITHILLGASGGGFLYTMNLLTHEKINGWVTVAFLILTLISIIAAVVVTKKTLEKK